MCGIAGILSKMPREDLESRVSRMVKAIRHRGPDGSDVASIPVPEHSANLVLGHARLSILDLSDFARQPMSDAETGSCLIYNGELYNFRDVRNELATLGHRFTSSGDTEVLLRALGEWGSTAVEKLEGMFAFAYWDGVKRELMLARDTMGIKPIVYAQIGDTLVFGSELRALVASGLVANSIDHDAVDSFLYYGAVIEPRTILREAKFLAPGHILHACARDGITVRKFTRSGTSQAVGEQRIPSRTVAMREVERLMSAAVDSQLISDVPVGVSLSGGIDSTLIASYAATSTSQPDIRLLTVDTSERGYSEGEFAQQVSKQLKLPHHVERLTPGDLLRMMPAAISAMDQPTVDGINTYIISRIAHEQGIKVLLSGLGGDEVFGGYTTFVKVPILRRNSRALSSAAKFAGRFGWGRHPQFHKVAQSDRSPGQVNTYLLQRAIRWRESQGFLSSLPPGPPDAAAIPEETERMLRGSVATDSYRSIAVLEMSFYMRNQLLRDADIFSSAHGVEMRVPMLDSRLVNYALRLPESYHLHPLRRKQMLRSLVGTKYGRPAARRKKMGFVLPWDVWLRKDLYSEMQATLLDGSAYDVIGVHVTQAERMLQAFKRSDPGVPWTQVWSLYTLARTVNRLSA